MKLYYTPGACSLGPHIALLEAGFKFDLEKVDLVSKKTASGGDFTMINPKGYVPALVLDDGSVLTEAGVILQYIADQKPEAGLAPRMGSMERYHLMEWINFISTEIHKAFGPFWDGSNSDPAKQGARDYLAKRFGFVEQALAKSPFLMGNTFTVADAYLFTVVNWTNFHAIDLGPWPKLKDFMGRVAARPRVHETLKSEGLVK